MTEYKILSELGRGGMGVVYRAIQEPLGREVAVKLLLGNIKDRPDLYKRFQREIQACIRLNHPNIIKIIDTGEMSERPFFAMEYLAGARPLDEVIKDEAPFPLARAFDVAIQLLDALAYVHNHEMLHRDLKPGNVMIGPGPRVTLMDFGLVKDLNATVLTQEGTVVGTPRYIAPEIIKGKPQGPGIDLWAVGAILYEMLTKRRAFVGDTTADIVQRIVSSDPDPVTQFRPSLPKTIDLLVRRFLQKDPARRIKSAEDARRALENWLESHPQQEEELLDKPPTFEFAFQETSPIEITLPEVEGGASATPTPSGLRTSSSQLRRSTMSFVTTAPPSPPTSPATTIAAVAAGVALLVVAGLGLRAVLRSPRPSPTASAVSEAALTGLGYRAAADGIVVSFQTDREGAFAARVAPRPDSVPFPAVEEKESAPSRDHRMTILGIPPGATCDLTIVDGTGAVAARKEVATLTLREAAVRLTTLIKDMDCRTAAKQFANDLQRARRQGRTDADRDRALEGFRKKWQTKLHDIMRLSHLTEVSPEFTRVRDQVFSSSSVPGADKRDLYEAIQSLLELEESAIKTRIQLERQAARLLSRHYGQNVEPTLSRPDAIAMLFYQKDPFYFRETAIYHSVIWAHRSIDEDSFRTFADIRDDPGHDSILADVGRAFLVVPNPVRLPDLPPEATVELTCVLDDTKPSVGFRILVSQKPEVTRTNWKLLAHVRPLVGRRHRVHHTIPANVLSQRPFYIRVELAYSLVSALLDTDLKQDGRCKWIGFGYKIPH